MSEQPTPRKRWLSDREYVIEDEQPTASAGDVERRLAEALRVASMQRGPEHRIAIAKRLLESDWIAQHDADVRREERERIAERMEAEVRPLLDEDKWNGGYDCCGCGTYDQILDHAIRIVREARGGAR